MGMLIDGQRRDVDRTAGPGSDARNGSQFRDVIGLPRFPAEPGRYHLIDDLDSPPQRTILSAEKRAY